MTFGLQVSDDGLDGAAAAQFALNDTEVATLPAGDEDATGFCARPRLSLVEIGAPDRTADECLGGVN